MSEKDKFSDEKLEKCFKNISTKTEIGVAVSGGPDSMALLLLLDRWLCRRSQLLRVVPNLTVFTIDHGLRSEAIDECRFVVSKAQKLGYDAKILPWTGEPPTTRVQETARDIRYQLLAAACHLRDIKILMTAHHLDDQAETFLMRLARGSGVEGLASMAPQSRRYGLRIFRPLLSFEKSDLSQLLEANGWDYIVDPSNKDRRFERVRLREASEQLSKLGLTSDMVALSATRLRRAKMALNEVANQFLEEHAIVNGFGTARIDQLALYDAPDEIAIRALSKLLKICGGSHDVPNMARLESLLAKMKRDFSTNQTLAGCRLIAKGDFWLIVRELGRITETAKAIVPDGCMFWDARYIVCAQKDATKKIVAGPLDRPADLKGLVDEKSLQNMPKEALSSLLTLRLQGEIIAIPALDFWSSEAISAGLQAEFITSDDRLEHF